MKNKILVVFSVLALALNIQLGASSTELDTTPNWIEVDYANLATDQVSEYQLVTVKVSNYGLWFLNNDYTVSVDYDPNQLELVNSVYTDALQNSSVKTTNTITSENNNFAVSYQFYLKPNVPANVVPVTVTKLKNGSEESSATINLQAYSETTKRDIKFGDITLRYNVTTYTNDGTNIEYNIHFDVVQNPHKDDFTMSLKKNNMSISDTDIYQAKVRFNSGSAVAIDKNNFSFTMNRGDSFDLNITSTVEGLSAKDDRFDFFIYFQSGDDFIRLSPLYYRSELIGASTNTRVIKYSYIAIGISVFFMLLTILYFSTNYRRNK